VHVQYRGFITHLLHSRHRTMVVAKHSTTSFAMLSDTSTINHEIILSWNRATRRTAAGAAAAAAGGPTSRAQLDTLIGSVKRIYDDAVAMDTVTPFSVTSTRRLRNEI
jgi:hypothetical protein